MPRPIYITEKLVFDAADNLLKQGMPFVEITNMQIRKELGNKGSMEHIQPLLRDWKKKKTAVKGLEIDMPDEFKTDLIQFGSRLWESAAEAVEGKIAIKYKDYRQTKDELGAMSQSHDEMDSKLTASEDNISHLYDRLITFKEDVEGHKRELSVHRQSSEKDKYIEVSEEKMAQVKSTIEDIIEKYLKKDISATSPQGADDSKHE